MPNRPQLVFLATFFIAFSSLLALSKFLSSKLRESGYDLSRLILIGIPQSQNTPHNPIPNQMASSFLDVNQSLVAQLFALFLALATSAFIYLKFGRSGMSSFSFLFTFNFSHPGRDQVKKPILDPKDWQEFPLKEKIVVSPNTAVSVVCLLLFSLSLTRIIAIDLPCHAQMTSLVSLLASIYLSPRRLMEKRLCVATPLPAAMMTSVILIF